MAFIKIDNVRVAGFSACVPKTVVKNGSDNVHSTDYDAAAFIETTGVRERRFDDICVSDLFVPAAERLISDLKWEKSDIDALIVVTQTSEYRLPETSCILQDRLGLPKSCYAEDLAIGCSGWVYGLSTIAALVATGGIKKALLLVGDARSFYPVNDPLFGYAGTVTAIEYKENATPMYYNFGTDGSGYDAIIIPDGGSRNPISEKSFIKEDVDGTICNRLQTRMKGMDVFSFGITTVPKCVKKLAENYCLNLSEFNYFVFHQANLKMNKMIQKKLKLEDAKVPVSMDEFGNTSGGSIPMTIVARLKDKIENTNTKMICCGFGVGLSWGAVAFETDSDVVVSDLVEV